MTANTVSNSFNAKASKLTATISSLPAWSKTIFIADRITANSEIFVRDLKLKQISNADKGKSAPEIWNFCMVSSHMWSLELS